MLLVRGRRDAADDEESFELPGGMVDRGESPQQAAARELGEEGGFEVARIAPLGSFFAVPAISAARCHVFEASLDRAGAQRLDDGETWTPVVVTPDDLRRYVDEGLIRDATSLAAICRYLVRRPV
ncbi:NUDIX hydrolase [Isoptericola sp. G70]|uniref:NUDIX hydrolase n=1 Tax=Isoptericola sp. G70 TaxID=3376633 RepID=UPI003A807E8C